MVKDELDWSKARAVTQALQAGLWAGGNRLLAAANETVPVDTGFLRSSGQVLRQGNTVAVLYTAPYAMIVHQRLDVRHRNGRAKWLELACLEERDKIISDINSTVESALR